jgi:hypothetical protein
MSIFNYKNYGIEIVRRLLEERDYYVFQAFAFIDEQLNCRDMLCEGGEKFDNYEQAAQAAKNFVDLLKKGRFYE